MNPISAEEDYERQFFILRMIVLGTIGCVFSILGLIFWVYFVYLWKTWDSGKQECTQISGRILSILIIGAFLTLKLKKFKAKHFNISTLIYSSFKDQKVVQNLKIIGPIQSLKICF